MKNIRTLGIITTVFLIIIIAALAVLAALGIFSKIPENTLPGDISIEEGTSEAEKEEWNPGGKTAFIKTSAGDIEITLANCAAAEKFIELAESGVFASAEFVTLAKDMFIQTGTYGEGFAFDENENPCVNGAAGFVIEDDLAFPSLVIITGDDLSKELSGKVLVFGKVTSGMDAVYEIASGENSGFTGGYSAANPVAITEIEISEG